MLKRALLLLAVVASPLAAQGAAAPAKTDAQMLWEDVANYLVQSAMDMPADKYGFKPTPAQWTYGAIIAHIAGDNAITCNAIAGTMPDKSPEPSATASKEELVKALKNSLAFCEQAVAKVNDGMLADSVTYYGRRATRVSPLIGLVMDWSDHYSQLAGYLRLNNVLPPTAKNGDG